MQFWFYADWDVRLERGPLLVSAHTSAVLWLKVGIRKTKGPIVRFQKLPILEGSKEVRLVPSQMSRRERVSLINTGRLPR